MTTETAIELVVVSTGYNAPTADRCRASVKGQVGVGHVQHIYVEAGEQDPPHATLANLCHAIDSVPRDAVIVWLDGDDWLARVDALRTVAAVYVDPAAWLTYGSFQFSDGRPGFAQAYTDAEWRHVRRAPWKATHLRTFRAQLFHRIDRTRDFMVNGVWEMRCEDLAVMWPLLEMAGPQHSAFISETLCVYNLADSFEFSATAANLAREKERRLYLEQLQPYRRVEAL